MENDIQIFTNPKFGEIRVAGTNDKPMFCLTDVCRALDIKNVSDCKSRLSQKGVGTTDTLTNGGIQKLTYIDEGNLYKCIFQSRKAEALEFQDWVTDEVLPSIRKHGGYLTPQKIDEILDDPDTIIRLATQLKEERIKRKEAERLNEINRPKVEFFDTVAGSNDAVSMNKVAKCLNFAKMGRNNLFKFLREKNVLMSNNLPYQQYIDSGHFRVIEQKYTGKDGMPQINYKTLVYQKGLDYIRRLLLKHGYVPCKQTSDCQQR